MLISCFVLTTNAQKKKLIESHETVKTEAKKAFEAAMKSPDGSLYLFGEENKIKGEYHFKITLGDKGKVVSVYVVERKDGDIPSQNKLKDAVKDFRFDFKLPKNKNYSLNYTFKF